MCFLNQIRKQFRLCQKCSFIAQQMFICFVKATQNLFCKFKCPRRQGLSISKARKLSRKLFPSWQNAQNMWSVSKNSLNLNKNHANFLQHYSFLQFFNFFCGLTFQFVSPFIYLESIYDLISKVFQPFQIKTIFSWGLVFPQKQNESQIQS